MIISNRHIPLWLFAAVSALFVASSFVWANDTIDVPYEVTSTHDTIALGDSIVVIHTVCAPICSSHVRVYNKEWLLVGEAQPPFRSAFPEAYIEDGKLLWRDNDNFDYAPCFY
jgi:hypothetical protein